MTSDTPGTPPGDPRRPVRSYVLRQGRMSTAQRRAIDALLPRHGIAFQSRTLDLDAAFGRRAPHVLEIGSGMGETTAAIAAARPEADFLALEVHGPGVGSLLRRIDAAGLRNLKVIQHDALEVLTTMIGEGTLDGVHVFFPDPWPKKRHHKRRIFQPAFARLVASRLAPGGYLHAATDWEPYAEWILGVLQGEPLLRNRFAAYAPRPEYRPLTKFEARGLRLGHRVHDLVFERIGIT